MLPRRQLFWARETFEDVFAFLTVVRGVVSVRYPNSLVGKIPTSLYPDGCGFVVHSTCTHAKSMNRDSTVSSFPDRVPSIRDGYYYLWFCRRWYANAFVFYFLLTFSRYVCSLRPFVSISTYSHRPFFSSSNRYSPYMRTS